MLKMRLAVTGILVVLALWGASAAHAQTSFTLSNCSPGCGTSPFGSVTLQQNTSTSVNVTVTLTPTTDRFSGSGSGNDVLTFDLSGSGSVTLANGGPDGLSVASGSFNQSPFGSFSFAVTCMGPMSTCNGSNTSSTNAESFTLTRTSGLTVSSFIPNSGGILFTSDITASGHSGIVAATPEPASMLLFGSGLLAIGTVVRRRRVPA